MELENVRNLMPDHVNSLFEDVNVYEYFNQLAKKVIQDESGVVADDFINEAWIFEPYAYILTKLVSPRVQATDETYFTRVETNFKRAIEILKRRANTTATTTMPNPFGSGVVE